MRVAAVDGRATILTRTDGGRWQGLDVETASRGRFGCDVQSLYPVWGEFVEWADAFTPDELVGQVAPVDESILGCPAPRPAQVFAIGLNYLDHAAEAGMVAERAVVPPTFTKFPSSLAGPNDSLQLTGDTVDWEVELVVVIGALAENVSVGDAWSHVAGLAVGQDYSDRTVQRAGPVPQFSLGKSYPGFGPFGPWLVSPDELASPDDLEIVCEVNGEQMQKGRTSGMVWSVPELISVLSGVCSLLPGDVIFTGTPAGVGAARTPARFLTAGDEVVSRIDGIGEMRQICLPPSSTQ